MPKNNKSELIKNSKFNFLTVIEFSHSDKRWRKFYKVKCDCGTEKIIMGSAMLSGNTKSCGCYAKKVKADTRISDNHSEVTAIILGYKRHAEARGFNWLLSREDVILIIFKNCYYCGAEPNNTKKTKNSIGQGLKYSGIDRINSKGNYDLHNTVPCCRICNFAKSNMTIINFQKWAIDIGAKARNWII